MRKRFNLVIVFFLAAFAVLSVYGAFLGAERAQAFFNAVPMTVFWCLLFVLLAAGFAVYPLLRKQYSLALIHLGCLWVLAGGLYGSQRVHQWVDRLSGRTTCAKGLMELRPGQLSDLVFVSADEDVVNLPFSILLEDAFLEFYGSPAIRLYHENHALIDIPAIAGQPVSLPEGLGTVQVVKVFKNFKLKQTDDRMVPYDDEESPDSNPAWELLVTGSNGETSTVYAFERFPMHTMGTGHYSAEYRRPQMVKDYKSVLQVVDQGQRVKAAIIEVNKPLYYKGYHFYQSTFQFDASGRPISGLSVVSSRGVWIVFAGYGLIFTGLLVQCWGRFIPRLQTRSEASATILNNTPKEQR